MTGRFITRKLRRGWEWLCRRPYCIRRSICRKLIHSKDLTIISNNCWAGKAYQYLGLPYRTPTVGLYFFSEEYLKFIGDLHHYLDEELVFIPAAESKYAAELAKRGQTGVPIGVLDDVEIVFLHYRTEKEAKEKWERRCRRVNWDNLFLKFSRMDGCTEAQLKQFSALPFQNKFMFNILKKPTFDCEYYWPGPQEDSAILRDTDPFPGKLPMRKLLARKPERYPDAGLIG